MINVKSQELPLKCCGERNGRGGCEPVGLFDALLAP